MANVVYNSAKTDFFKGTVDYQNDTIKVALVTSAYTPNADTHADFADITNEVSGTGYTAGGKTLANQSVAQDNTNDKAKYDADNVTWASSTITARGAVIYKSTGVASTSPLICYVDFGTDKSSSAGDFIIQWNSEGILNLS